MGAREHADTVGPTDDELARRLAELGTALVCDVLDGLGIRSSFLGPDVQPLWACPPFAGRAVTLRCEPVEHAGEEPYGKLFDALAERHPNAVLVISAGDHESGVWGELLSVAARARGVAGVVTDGLVRDRSAIVDLAFPVHAAGVSPLDSAGRQEFAALDVPLRFGKIEIRPGDWVVADDLGAVAVPADLVARTVELATEKAGAERTVRAELEAGMDLGDVFRRHGVL